MVHIVLPLGFAPSIVEIVVVDVVTLIVQIRCNISIVYKPLPDHNSYVLPQTTHPILT